MIQNEKVIKGAKQNTVTEDLALWFQTHLWLLICRNMGQQVGTTSDWREASSHWKPRVLAIPGFFCRSRVGFYSMVQLHNSPL